MSDLAEAFVSRLQQFKDDKQTAPLAAFRHSLAFDPGTHPASWRYVEPYCSLEWAPGNSQRLAMYAVAGLFAINPNSSRHSFAASLGMLYRQRDQSPGIESRFLTLLSADAENVVVYTRHAARLLAQEKLGCDYSRLLRDLSLWMYPQRDPQRFDLLRQRWAQDFYRPLPTEPAAGQPNTDSSDATEEESQS